MENGLKRELVVIYPSGFRKKFYITISLPQKTDSDYVCYIDSEGVLSAAAVKSYGLDALEAMTYALHKIDVLIFERENAFVIKWPDDTEYSRSKVDNYRWS